ncbi:LOW QUALITY PROTEIN: histone H1.8-like [Panthera leo]|uniref:LOW QUALITY PROTEIN: histone H1.8-like n=1 Tax=Panthera leo TaxID=9689 RepID=UPI001C6A345E|nr:LOW QUALITY PROTEIN: histone H1.8-like [Panthera leo]
MTAPRRPGEAKEKGPKQPTEAKKDPPNPGEVKRGPMKPGEVHEVSPKPGAAEKAPKQGSQTKDQEARLSEARKASQQPDKASQTLPSAPGSSGKSKVKGTRRSQTKESEVPKEAVAQGANVGPRVKAAAPLRGGGSKTVPERLARKTEAPKGPEGPRKLPLNSITQLPPGQLHLDDYWFVIPSHVLSPLPSYSCSVPADPTSVLPAARNP